METMTSAKFFELFSEKIEWGKTSKKYRVYLVKYENLLRAEGKLA